MIRKISIILSFLMVGFSFGQYKKNSLPENAKVIHQATKSQEYKVEVMSIIAPQSVDLKWMPILRKQKSMHHSKNNLEIQRIKSDKMKIKKQFDDKSEAQEEINQDFNPYLNPTLNRNFQGNVNNGSSPLDNSVAISNTGKIVSVINTSIEFYDENGVRTYTNSIENFFGNSSIVNVCDPLVVYDSGADRFVFFAQECSGEYANTQLLICFSQTNDPNGKWNNYMITGNPVKNNTWFDYPKVGLSTNELYITGNSFTNDGDFVEALLYQIDKNAGYAGTSLKWQYWNNITSGPFTLLPVSYGQAGNYGPGCYLVSTNPMGASTIDLYDLTDDMSASNEELKHYQVNTTAYSPAANGEQKGTTTTLDNGDCRTLSGFYLNDMIHFVFHSDYDSGYNGLNYNRLNLSTLSNTSKMFGFKGYEFSYPSIASFSNVKTDKSVLIGFGRTSSTIYPEMRAVVCDDAMNFGSSVVVKEGVSFTEFSASTGEVERWGDYTGICKRHNATNPTVWVSGMYGTKDNDWDTWIAELSPSSVSGIHDNSQTQSSNLYPNPVYDQFTLEFEMFMPTPIQIAIFNVNGELVQQLFNGESKAGRNLFSFNKSNLTTGTYFLKIKSADKIIQNEKIIISE